MNIGNTTSDNSDEINHNSNEELWLAMKVYHESGLSMMWGRAEDDPVKGKKAKSPLVTSWNSEVEGRFSLRELNRAMMKAGSTIKIAPIIICGKGSRNLIVIDVDVKHMPGIDVKFFLAIQQTFPELWKKIRRHKTPSGGYHLLYRTIVHVHFHSKNPGLAYQKDNPRAGIESRTHGGYVLAPPGMGYSVEYDVPIPTITVEEHESIFQLARLFNEKIVIIKQRSTKKFEEIYEENPFDHFDASSAAEKVLELNGWTFDYENSQFAHYTRPGKGGGVSASYHKDKRFYHFFTTSSEFDHNHYNGNYSPVAVKCLLEANNDWKKLYAILVKEGYGKHKEAYEAKLIKKAVETGKPLPGNFSLEAKEQFEAAIEENSTNYPHGIFWEYMPKWDSYKISSTKLINVANGIGIARLNNRLISITGIYFSYIDEAQAMSLLSKYIKEENEDYIKINDVLMAKWKQYALFLSTRMELKEITKNDILRSTEAIYFKPFLNGVLEITKDKIFLQSNFEVYGKLIDKDGIINHIWKEVTEEEYLECLFLQFIMKAIRTDWRYVLMVIGYLCFDCKTRGSGYLIMLLEGVHKGKGGGSGKGYLIEALGDEISSGEERDNRKWTTAISISGQQIAKGEAEMLQMWGGERLVLFSDAPKGISLSILKDVATDGGAVKWLFENVKRFSARDYPNLVISSQWGIDKGSDPGLERRVRILSFTNFFNIEHTISDEFGGRFPNIWEEKDWLGYYNCIAVGIHEFLKNGSRLDQIEEEDLMWEKNFDFSYGSESSAFRQWVGEIVKRWEKVDYFKSSELLHSYNTFYSENTTLKKLAIDNLHKAISEWAKRFGYDYKYGFNKRLDDGQYKRCSIRKLDIPQNGGEL